jgi:hypothetical protein
MRGILKGMGRKKTGWIPGEQRGRLARMYVCLTGAGTRFGIQTTEADLYKTGQI